MKISTKGRYAIESVVFMAAQSSNEYINLKKIASELNISDNYLEQIFMKLRREGYVESVRGVSGGYKLVNENVTAGDIIRAVEGPLVPAICLTQDNYNACGMLGQCPTQELWRAMTCALNNTADSISVATLAKELKALKSEVLL